MEVSRCVEDGNAVQAKQSASSCQENIHDMEASSFERSTMLDISEDMELDIIGCTENCEEVLVMNAMFQLKIQARLEILYLGQIMVCY